MYLAVALALTGAPVAGFAAGTEPAEESRNEGGFFTGGTVENGEYNLTFGAEYERRLSAHWGVMAITEHVDYYDAWVFLAPLTFRPWADRGLKLYFGPGVETKEAEDEPQEDGVMPADSDDGRQTTFVLRSGISWTFNAQGVLLTPQLEVDLGREDEYWEPAVVFGVSAGFEF